MPTSESDTPKSVFDFSNFSEANNPESCSTPNLHVISKNTSFDTTSTSELQPELLLLTSLVPSKKPPFILIHKPHTELSDYLSTNNSKELSTSTVSCITDSLKFLLQDKLYKFTNCCATCQTTRALKSSGAFNTIIHKTLYTTMPDPKQIVQTITHNYPNDKFGYRYLPYLNLPLTIEKILY